MPTALLANRTPKENRLVFPSEVAISCFQDGLRRFPESGGEFLGMFFTVAPEGGILEHLHNLGFGYFFHSFHHLKALCFLNHYYSL